MKIGNAGVIMFMVVLSSVSHADCSDPIITLKCDISMNKLTIVNGAIDCDESDKYLEAHKGNAWDLWKLTSQEDAEGERIITSTHTATKECKLKGAIYKVSITPMPGNFNIGKQCGANIAGVVEVKNGSKSILKKTQLDSVCWDENFPSITKISINPRDKSPKIFFDEDSNESSQ